VPYPIKAHPAPVGNHPAPDGTLISKSAPEQCSKTCIIESGRVLCTIHSACTVPAVPPIHRGAGPCPAFRLLTTTARSSSCRDFGFVGSSSGSKSSYQPFGCQLGFRLGGEVIWCHDASHRLAADPPNPRLGKNGRAPVSRFAQVRDNRKLRNVSHWDSPRMTGSDVNAAMGLPVPGTLARA
jgi:hypothetical protein